MEFGGEVYMLVDTDERELRLGQLRLIVIIMIAIFVAILSYTIWWSCDYNEKYGFFKKCTAEVVKRTEDDEGTVQNILMYYDENGVEYRLTVDNADYDICDKVTIYYDRNNPLGIVYRLDSKRIWLPILTALFGLGCITLTIVFVMLQSNVYNKKHNKNKQKTIPSNDIVHK